MMKLKTIMEQNQASITREDISPGTMIEFLHPKEHTHPKYKIPNVRRFGIGYVVKTTKKQRTKMLQIVVANKLNEQTRISFTDIIRVVPNE